MSLIFGWTTIKLELEEVRVEVTNAGLQTGPAFLWSCSPLYHFQVLLLLTLTADSITRHLGG